MSQIAQQPTKDGTQRASTAASGGTRQQSGAAAAEGKPRKPARIRLADWGLPLLVVVVTIGIWQAVCSFGAVQAYLLPGPGAVALAMFDNIGMYASQSVPTIVAIFVGFALAIVIALPVAVLMVYSDLARRALYPLLVLAQVVPKVAIAPLFIIWFGFGQMPKIVMVALICFFPVVIDALVGFRKVRPESLMLVRSMGANRWQAFWKVRWPWALPSIFAGIKVGITLAVVGAVVAEFVGSNSGLGVVLITARGNMDTLTVFASIAWLTVIGFILFLLVEVIERLLLPGKRPGHVFEASGSL